jgi:hypothetical protein
VDHPPGRRGPSARHQLLADRPWTRYGPYACWSARRVLLLKLTDRPPVGSGLSARCPQTVCHRLADRPPGTAQDC